ncbi:hypothetical protein [Nocardia sp. NPDC057227]|uniref:hypothetical protein n=1 Tax=Nocardia sp. NPDC057227 TaxID=3346056 RepID=UPI00362D987F
MSGPFTDATLLEMTTSSAFDDVHQNLARALLDAGDRVVRLEAQEALFRRLLNEERARHGVTQSMRADELTTKGVLRARVAELEDQLERADDPCPHDPVGYVHAGPVSVHSCAACRVRVEGWVQWRTGERATFTRFTRKPSEYLSMEPEWATEAYGFPPAPEAFQEHVASDGSHWTYELTGPRRMWELARYAPEEVQS